MRCAVVVVSDTRTEETDVSGRCAIELLRKHGHEVVSRSIVPNRPGRIRRALKHALGEADLVLTVGGTGPGPKDITIETVRPLLAKELPGFGEIFRARSVREIGTAVVLTRAILGVEGKGRVVVCVPGSEAAVRLALEEVLLPELSHLAGEARGIR